MSSRSKAASVRYVEEADSSAVEASPAVPDSTPEGPVRDSDTSPRGEPASLGNGELETRSPETANMSTDLDARHNASVNTVSVENASAQEHNTSDQTHLQVSSDPSPSCLTTQNTDPRDQNCNGNNIKATGDDLSRTPINTPDPLNSTRVNGACENNDCKKESDDPLQSCDVQTDGDRNETAGVADDTQRSRDELDGERSQTPPTPAVGPAPAKPENNKRFFQRNKKSNNEGKLFLYLIKVVLLNTGV